MANVNTQQFVTVPVTALWTSPSAPRSVDGWSVAAEPDVVAWLADLDAAAGRPGLHGRVLTQLERGEPVVITADPAVTAVTAGADGQTPGSPDQRWLQVVAPLQPSTLDARGYPGWVLAAHIGEQVPVRAQPARSGTGQPETGADARAFVAAARTHLGVPYLWGGLCDEGLDCSGLVHLSLRRLGIVVPRDADDQYDACQHLSAARAEPGDLFFFAHEGRRPHHVGIVTGPYRMLHAPETGSVIVEEPLSPARRRTLIGAGRLPLLRAHTASAG
jgi:gamma-D-glutamyl-L-lysine dipeptidyl-peptidase